MNKEILEQFGGDPITLVQQWLDEAVESEINDPEAMNLATCTADGRPSNRMVLLKEISERGFKFHSNAESRKGTDIADNPYASLCLYWKSTRKQIRIEGRIEIVSEAESNAYFNTRNIEKQIGAWASKQSRPYASREDLAESIAKYEGEFASTDNIPRPPYWIGYRVIPERIEFWIAHRDRLHTRFEYTKSDDGWDSTWLYP